jgi:aromatic ring-opening dioxygenase LigB subunit
VSLPLVYAAVAPHGSEAIPLLSGNNTERFSRTTGGLRELARRLRRADPDTVIIATPHGIRIDGAVSISTASYAAGELTDHGAAFRVTCEGDPPLARNIVEQARREGIPAAGVVFGTAEGPLSVMPLDWGVLVPWWFFMEAGIRCKLVVMTPSRDIGPQPLVRLGHVIADLARRDERRIAFVASADQAHAHDPAGPYGFDECARVYDDYVMGAVQENRLGRLLSLDMELVDRAKPDSLWQMLILHGVLERVPMSGKFLSYEVPTYFGMLCAVWEHREGH